MRSVSLLCLISVFAFGCKREQPVVQSTTAPATPATATGGGPKALLPGATCAFPERLDHDVTIAAGCVADVTESALVENGATLTIEKGVRLRFQPGTYIEVGHRGSRLVARGSADQPIVFTSAASSPKCGDWVGLVLDDTIGESTLEHAVVEFAGQESHGGSGAITVFRTSVVGTEAGKGKVAIRNVTFRDNETAISDPTARGVFGAFSNNVFQRNARALRVSAPVFVALGENNDFGDRIDVLGGTVAAQGTWPKTKGDVIVTEPIYVNGKGDKAASLTIARGSVVKFAPKTWLEIGTGGPAELTAQGVTFTSSEASPKAGDWVGLIFGDKTRRALVTDSTIEYAGAEEHGGDAAVTFVGNKSWQGLDVNFGNVRFHQIAQAHFSSNGDGCDKALDPKHGIQWAGLLEPCR
jgi:hypothetical protein